MLIKKIKYNGRDKNIKINISSQIDYTGEQESINDFVSNELGLSINSVVDGEKTIFRPVSTNSVIRFRFTSNGTGTNLLNAGFTQNEINFRSELIRRSFFIVETYDSVDLDNQRLLHTGYFNGSRFFNPNGSTEFTQLKRDDDFTNLYIPNDFFVGKNSSTVSVYNRYYFYNAKTGRLETFFYNRSNVDRNKSSSLFIEEVLTLSSKSYELNTIGNALEQLPNNDYTNKINDSIDSIALEKPTYPAGNFFDGSNITYEII